MSELLLTTSERVRSCEWVPEGVRVQTDTQTVLVDAEPDDRLALRLCRLATRVMSVEISDHADGAEPTAEVTAVWHRIPHSRPVPLDAAVALTISGVPTYLSRTSSR